MQPGHGDSDEPTSDRTEQPLPTEHRPDDSCTLCPSSLELGRYVDDFMINADGNLTVFQVKTSRGPWAKAAQHAVSADAAQYFTQAATDALLHAFQQACRVWYTGSLSHSMQIEPAHDANVAVALDTNVIALLLPQSRYRWQLMHELTRPRVHVELERGAAVVAFADLLTHWQELTVLETNCLFLCDEHRRVLGELGEAETKVLAAVGAAHHACQEALAVRESIVHDDPILSRAKLAEFTSTWLGRKPHPELVEVVGDALLYAYLEDFPDDNELVRRLKRAAIHQYRIQRPLTDTQLCRHRVTSLDQPLPSGHEATVQNTLVDKIPNLNLVNNIVETRLDAWEERIEHVLGRLKPAELDVARAYARDDTLSWHQAAESCGRDPKFGTRVQRKLRRLGEQFLARSAARPRTA